MLLDYLPVMIAMGLVAVMGIAPLVVNVLVSPRNPYKEKGIGWECGLDPIGDATGGHQRIHFFVIAILFIVFDVETLFMFPWAVILTDPALSTLVLIEMIIFVLILSVGLIYAWAKGALDWL